MKNNDNNTEQMLLNDISFEDLIRKKIEQEFANDIKSSQKHKEIKKVTDISKAPKYLIFSTKSVFKLFNRKTGVETYINGVQAEALLGVRNNIREKVSQGQLSAFAANDVYVKFEFVKYSE